MFADLTDPFTLARRLVQRIESDKGNGLFALSKSSDISERVNDCHRRQIPDTRMSEKHLYLLILIRLFFQFVFELLDFHIQLFKKNEPRFDKKCLGSFFFDRRDKCFPCQACLHPKLRESLSPCKCL